MTSALRRLVAAASGVAVATVVTVSHAGGLYVSDRGVRPLGRGGAFVAGADDLGAIAYNPAGVFDAGDQLLFDASVLLFQSEYARQARLRQIDPNSGSIVAEYTQTFEAVQGSSPPIPIPTLAGSFAVHEDWRLAFGAYAPYAVLPSYPETVNDQPAPQRYSLVSLDGSLLAVIGGYVAWRPIPELRLGIGVELLTGTFTSRTYVSGCLPERFFCAPEDPDWDIAAEISAAPIVSPSGTLGAIWEFSEGWRLGGSFHLPYWIIAPATYRARLPAAAIFRNAVQEGDSATMEFQLPWEIRLGLELRDPTPGLRIEVGADYHHWAIHDAISVTPDGVALTNLPGFPERFLLPEVTINRGFQSTVAGRIGAEYTIPASDTVGVTPRAGFSYETSAVPTEHLSILTLDAGKATPSVGISVAVGDARFDAVYAHQFYPATTVDPAEARLEQTVPLRANPSRYPDYINGGYYSWSIDIIGVGFAYTLDKATKQTSTPDPEEDEEEVEPVKPAKPKEPEEPAKEEEPVEESA